MTIVSVAMATHNGAAYIAEQIASILAQSRPVDEIVVSDDASSDDTVGIITQMFAELATRPATASTRPALVVLRNDRPLGVTANFEQALSRCCGALIALSDQDDVWHPDRITRQLARFEAEPGLLALATNARSVDSNGKPLGYDHFTALEISRTECELIQRGAILDALLRRNLATGATMMVRQSLIERARPFPPTWLHDEWLAIMGAILGRVELSGDCLIDYRQHANNLVGMRRLTLTDKVGRLLEPGSARNRRLRDRAQALADRMDELPGAPARVRDLTHEKVQFEEARLAMPAYRPARVPTILRHLANGNYQRFGTGWKDAIRNFVQPAHASKQDPS